MENLSSHVLDSITGRSAQGVRVTCCKYSANSVNQTVFDVTTNHEGRIAVEFDIQSDKPGTRYDLIFYSGDYFRKTQPSLSSKRQVVEEVVVRLTLPDAGVLYHVPVLISPHSQTVWWSE